MFAQLCLNAGPTIYAAGIPRHGEASSVDHYQLPELWSFHIYSYEATLELDGKVFQIRPGDASLIPPGVSSVYRYAGSSEHVYFHFSPGAGSDTHGLLLVQSLGPNYQAMDRIARSAVGRFRYHSGYAEAVLWNLLWGYADLASTNMLTHTAPYHPLVSMAVLHIEQRLSSPMTVGSLAREVGVTDGYLTRLFSRELGVSVSAFVRGRRATLAQHLLTSTNMPIKAVARSVGVPRLTQFNRLMHQTHGMGPRQIRSSVRPIDGVTETL